MIFKQSNSRAHGFTLVEMLVVIAIISVLAMLLLGSFNYAVQRSETTRCIHSMRQIGAALHAYRGDHDDWLPPGYPITASHGEFGVPPPIAGSKSPSLTLHHHLEGYLTETLVSSSGSKARGEMPFCPGGMGGISSQLDSAERLVRVRGSYAINTLLLQFRVGQFPPPRRIQMGNEIISVEGVVPLRETFDPSRYPYLLEVRSDGSGVGTWSFIHQNQALNGSFGETGTGWGQISPGRSHGYGDALNFMFLAGNVETVPRNDFRDIPAMNKAWNMPNNPNAYFHHSGTVPSGMARPAGEKAYFTTGQLSMGQFKMLYPQFSTYEAP